MTPGLIETARVADGRCPLWPWHLERLRASAAALGLPLPASLPVEAEMVRAGACAAGVVAVRLVLVDAAVRLDARPVPPADGGWRACAASRLAGAHPLRAHKTTDREEHVAAAAAARARGCQEALWVDPAGRLSEGTITNLFVCRERRLLTPRAGGNLLPGIARGRLLAAGRLGGHPVEEAELTPADLLLAEEAFVTNAVRGAVPLVAWEGVPLGRGGLWQEAQRTIFRTGLP